MIPPTNYDFQWARSELVIKFTQKFHAFNIGQWFFQARGGWLLNVLGRNNGRRIRGGSPQAWALNRAPMMLKKSMGKWEGRGRTHEWW